MHKMMQIRIVPHLVAPGRFLQRNQAQMCPLTRLWHEDAHLWSSGSVFLRWGDASAGGGILVRNRCR